MSTVLGFIVFMIWLALGGWSWRKFEFDDAVLGYAAIMCAVLGPFVFGIALAEQAAKKKPTPSNQEGEGR